MSKKSIRERGKVEIPNPLYLNANLIYSEALQRLKGGSSGTLRDQGSRWSAQFYAG
ncbi:MAG: hypothetical protein AABX47_08945 [Nanoarchaeota archaeon]